jgi:transposase
MALPFEMDLTDKKVFLRIGASDFRRGIRGMVSLVVGAMDLKMDEKSLFVFCSTSKKQIRIVYTEGAGIWMCTRRIRYGRYPWPMNAKAASQLTVQELKDLLADPVPLEYLRASGKVARMELHI